MNEQIASGIAVVKVVMTDSVIDGSPSFQLWAVALPNDQAVAAVKERIPAYWTAELTDQRLTQEHVRHLNMKPGSVTEVPSKL